METKIRAQDISFGEFHKKASEIFYIPSLQRPYTWESKKQVNKLWEDITENEDRYYIGSIVTIIDGGSTSRDQIIDGQQRLTTLHLMLAAMRDFIKSSKEKSAIDTILEIEDMLIKFYGSGSKIRLSFSNKNSSLVYEAIINQNALGSYDSEIQKRFIRNFTFLKSRISDYCGSGNVSTVRFKELFEKIKKLQIIFIECKDKSAAFRLFESINATGVDLTTNDLIKNSIFEMLYEDKQLFDFVEDGWETMVNDFNEDGSYLKTYIRQHWISTVDYTNHSKLFEDFLLEYKTKEQITDYAISLFDSSSTYLAIRNGDIDILDKIKGTRNDKNEIREILKFLSSLGVDQVYSVLLNLYNFDSKSFRKDLIRLASFQFLFKYIPGSPSIPEKIFANFCTRNIEKKITKNSLFNELLNLCRDSEAAFVKKYVEKTKYIEGNSVGLQFVLEKYLHTHSKASKFLDPTIEHIVPQDRNDEIYNKFNNDPKDTSRKVQEIGNLTILEKNENSDRKLFNKSFTEKYPLYKKHFFDENRRINKFNFDKNPYQAIENRSAYVAKKIYMIFITALETGKWQKLK